MQTQKLKYIDYQKELKDKGLNPHKFIEKFQLCQILTNDKIGALTIL